MNDQSQNFNDAFIDAVDALEREDYETAYKLFLPLAEQGYVDAQSNLGMLYYLGQGVLQDYKESEKWCKLATALGTTYEALNVWIFVILIPVAMTISMLMNLYFIWKPVRHECVLRETNSN